MAAALSCAAAAVAACGALRVPGQGALLPAGRALPPGGVSRRVLLGPAALASAVGCASPASAAYLRTVKLSKGGDSEIRRAEDQLAEGVRLEETEGVQLQREATPVVGRRDLVLDRVVQENDRRPQDRAQEKPLALEEVLLEDAGRKVTLLRGDDQRRRRDRAMRLGGVAATLQALKDELFLKA